MLYDLVEIFLRFGMVVYHIQGIIHLGMSGRIPIVLDVNLIDRVLKIGFLVRYVYHSTVLDNRSYSWDRGYVRTV